MDSCWHLTTFWLCISLAKSYWFTQFHISCFDQPQSSYIRPKYCCLTDQHCWFPHQPNVKLSSYLVIKYRHMPFYTIPQLWFTFSLNCNKLCLNVYTFFLFIKYHRIPLKSCKIKSKIALDRLVKTNLFNDKNKLTTSRVFLSNWISVTPWYFSGLMRVEHCKLLLIPLVTEDWSQIPHGT